MGFSTPPLICSPLTDSSTAMYDTCSRSHDVYQPHPGSRHVASAVSFNVHDTPDTKSKIKRSLRYRWWGYGASHPAYEQAKTSRWRGRLVLRIKSVRCLSVPMLDGAPAQSSFSHLFSRTFSPRTIFSCRNFLLQYLCLKAPFFSHSVCSLDFRILRSQFAFLAYHQTLLLSPTLPLANAAVARQQK